MNKINDVFLIDSSAIFSGKPIDLRNGKMLTTSFIADEFQPGGRDFRLFQFLIEKGLKIQDPSKDSLKKIMNVIKIIGEQKRLSTADISILALAYEIKLIHEENPILVTDDYSIQNIASYLKIPHQSVNQRGITKRFKWERRCRGCRHKIIDDADVCPICGSTIKHEIRKSSSVKKQR
jgi:UPF0271 protein